MKRHLIWIIAGSATVGLTVPAFAAMQSATAPDDNGVPGELRGNCDEAEHANDPNCLIVTVPKSPGSSTPITIDIPIPPTSTTSVTTTASASESNAPGAPTKSLDDGARGGTAPSTSVPGDVSGPCDEVEHANDPRCVGGAAGIGDNSGSSDDSTDDRSGHDADDDSSGRGGDDSSGHDAADDSSGRGGDDSSGHGGDDSSGHGGDDSSGRGGDDSSGHDADDDSSGHDGDDSSGHGGGD
jgi:hypothetical protein